MSGISFWENCRNHGQGIDLIKNFLLGRNNLDNDLRLFLETASPKEIHEKLIRPISWITGQRETEDIQNTISDILINLGEKYHVLRSAAADARAKLFEQVCNAIALSRIEDRSLTRANFLRIFEQATIARIPRIELERLQASILSLGQQGSQLTPELSFVQGSVPINSVPTPLNGIFHRTDLVQTVSSQLHSVDLFLLSGGTGIGKSTLAACVARGWEKIFWISFRGMTPGSVGFGLRRLTAAISANQEKSLIVLDDIELLPAAIKEFESSFVSLLLVAKEKASPVLLTSQRDSQHISRRFSEYPQNSLRVPLMSFPEVHAYCLQRGCQDSASHTMAINILARTSGHPTLVHALILSLDRSGWIHESNALANNNLEVLNEERAEARQLLFSLTENNRELLYRLTLIEDPFRRDHALRIGDLDPPISFAGDGFDLVVGPWIEPLANNYFRVSPLLHNEAERVWTEDRCRKLHEGIADAILSCEPRTTIEANSVLRHAWKARSPKHLRSICINLMGADEEILHAAFERMLWFAAFSLKPGEVLFEEDPRLSHLLRSFQYRIARQTHERVGDAVLAAWLAEIEQRDASLFEKFELCVNQTVLSSAVVPPNRLLTIVETIQEVEKGHQDLIRTVEDQLRRRSSEDHAWDTTSVLENVALLAIWRYRDVQEFEELIKALRAARDSTRSALLGALAKSPTSAVLLVNRVWTNEADKPNPDWPRCLAIFNEALSDFVIWSQPILIDASIRAITVITDEYLHQSEKALQELNHLANAYGRDSGILRAARITVLYSLGQFRDVVSVARNSVSVWESELARFLHQMVVCAEAGHVRG